MMAVELLDRVGWTWVRRFGDVLGPSASLVGTTVVTSAMGFAYWWAAARMAPIHEVGAATAVISAMTLLGTIGMFGFGTMLIAEAGRCRDVVGSLIATSLLVVTVLATAMAAVSWAALRLSHGTIGAVMASPWVAAGFIVGVGLTAAGMVLDQALVGIRASSVQLYRNSYFSVVKLALLVLVAATVGSHSEVTMVWVWLAGIAVSMVATARHLAARRYRLGQPVRLSALRGRVAMTFHHNTLNVSLTVPRLGLPLLVASLLGVHANAAFYAAWMISGFLYILPMHLSTALFAVAVGDSRALAPRLRAALRVCLLLGGSAAVAVAALAGPAMRSFGPGYEMARTALVVMAFAYFPNVFKQLLRRRGPGRQQAAEGRRGLRHRCRPGGVPDRGGGLFRWADRGLAGIPRCGDPAGRLLPAAGAAGAAARRAACGTAGVTPGPGVSMPGFRRHCGRRRHHPDEPAGRPRRPSQGNPGTLSRREKWSGAVPGTSPWGEAVQPRVFIDHSGYDLLNIGDTAMLKATVTRLQERWPRARLQIITTSRERLAALCPGTEPIILMADRGPIGRLPDRVRGGIGLRYKRAICGTAVGRLAVQPRRGSVAGRVAGL